MAVKKFDLCSAPWASCDDLRSGMDASQHKDRVLFMLFIKYISNRYGGSDDFAPPVIIPKGASFRDMIALNGKPDIGDKISIQVIQPLIDKNVGLARSNLPDFNDSNNLEDGGRVKISGLHFRCRYTHQQALSSKLRLSNPMLQAISPRPYLWDREPNSNFR